MPGAMPGKFTNPYLMNTDFLPLIENEPRMISVIIPVWRDWSSAATCVAQVRKMAGVCEVIVSAASADRELAETMHTLGVSLVESDQPSRGRQMDRGAAAASGEWLLFHHVDTDLTPAHLQALLRATASPVMVGGAFYRRFDERHPGLRWLEPVERWHNRTFGALYGDQSIFVRREVFARLGGFRGLPLMEDVDFSLRLRRAGKIALLDPPIASSPRRHLARGPWRTTARNAAILALFHLGVSPHRLHRWYYPEAAAFESSGATPHDFAAAGAPHPGRVPTANSQPS